ncbi:MAG: hypothetical protein N3A38_15125 [Planctomycetota bacterium]|nr:hypothetical protein [Planctomycetota bacterium]
MNRAAWIMLVLAIIGAAFYFGWRSGNSGRQEDGRIKEYGGKGVVRPIERAPILKAFKGSLEEGGERRGKLRVPPIFGNELTFDVEAEGAIEFRWFVDGRLVPHLGQEWSERSDRSWTAPAPGKYRVRAEARSARGGGKVAHLEKEIYVKPLHIYSFEADPRSEPDRCLTGELVHFEVDVEIPDMLGEVDYEYRYSVNGAVQKHPDDGKEWTDSDEFPFRPDKPGDYEIKVEVRRIGQSEPEESASLTYHVADCLALDLTIAPEDQANVGDSVTLDCFADSIQDEIEYRFTVRQAAAGSKPEVVKDSKGLEWSRDYSRLWVPKAPGQYQVTVEVRNAGAREAQDVRSEYYLVLDRGF